MSVDKAPQRNHHFVFIAAPYDIVWPEVVLWGEASWWPKGCQMQFVPAVSGERANGARFRQRVTLPKGPQWDVEVTEFIENKKVERTFLNGIFKGKEYVEIEKRINGTRVDYTMEFTVNGFLNGLLWILFFRQLHNKNIKRILAALQAYAVQETREQGREL